MVRFDAGRSEPLNQALYFAEIYSLGGDATCFYKSDPAGNLSREMVLLGRDSNGFIDELTYGGSTYLFDLDSAGNVTGYTIVPEPAALTLLFVGLPALLRRRNGSVDRSFAVAPRHAQDHALRQAQHHAACY